MRSLLLAVLLLVSGLGIARAADTPPLNPAITPVHGLAMYDAPKYPADFTHFSYVNPDAPKGGELRQLAIGTFDSLNPFIVKGESADAAAMPFDTLMAQSADEPDSEYGLIAESVEVPPDRSWVIFNLRPQARFHDGSPITADDVIFSFDILRTKGQPFYRAYYHSVVNVEKLGERRVKFSFEPGSNHELPLILGQLPVLSKKYWTGRAFDETTLDPPLGSGPYKIESFEVGRDIVLARVPDYWAKDLPVNKGLYNFDRIRTDYYRDQTVALQAFKAGAYDVREEEEAKKWATEYDFPAVSDGLVKLRRFENKRPTGMQGYVFNLHKGHTLFSDMRVRRALSYAFDFEWSNKALFYGQYTRTASFFSNSDLASSGLPSPDELKLLDPLRGEIPDEVFTAPYKPPRTDDIGGIRNNLHKALQLFEEAGWIVRDGKLVNFKTGNQFAFEILLDNPAFERVTLPFVANLKRLGIDATIRTVDTTQYKNRIDNFDFDMVVGLWPESDSPGNEQREFWGSATADQPGSRNLVGIKSKAVDTLIDDIIAAPTRKDLVTACHALDRVLLWSAYVIPHFHLSADRVAYWDKFGMPSVIPDQGWQLMSWWIDPAKAARINPDQKH